MDAYQRAKERERTVQRTIRRIVVVDVGVTEGTASVDIAAYTDRHHLPDLAKNIIQLRVSHAQVQVPDVQGRRWELDPTTARRRARDRVGLKLDLRHLTLRIWTKAKTLASGSSKNPNRSRTKTTTTINKERFRLMDKKERRPDD